MSPDQVIVYVLTNEAFPTFIKIGTTRREISLRMQELFSSGVPVPFECYYAATVTAAMNVEKRLHRAFDVYRVNKNREFFEIEPEAAADIIRMVAIEDVTPDTDPVETPDDKAAIEKLEKRAERFSFKMVGIEPGSTLTFKLDENLTCRTLDNRRVEFQGQETSLSAAALAALKQHGFEWKSAHGAQYWMYRGQTLLELRNAIEDEE